MTCTTKEASLKKKLSFEQKDAFSPLNPILDFSKDINITLKIGNETLNNLAVFNSSFENTGKSPILPADFVDPLTVTVKKPWRIIAVANSRFSDTYIHPNWLRISDNEYRAEPTLINPGDNISVYTYVVNDANIADSIKNKRLTSDLIKWKARIINLRSFDKVDSPFDSYMKGMWGISVDLYGWSLIFFAVCAPVFLLFYLYLLKEANILNNWGNKSILIVLLSGMVSVSAAESLATYIFKPGSIGLLGVYHLYNLPPIIIHMLLVLYLTYKGGFKRNAPQRQSL